MLPVIDTKVTHSIFTCPSSVADRIAVSLLSNCHLVDKFIKSNQEMLCASYEDATATLDKFGITYQQSNAAFFVWADLFSFWSPRLRPKPSSVTADDFPGSKETEMALEVRLNEHLLDHKVFLSAGNSFGHEQAGWFRITFALDRDYLHEGLEQLAKALKSFKA